MATKNFANLNKRKRMSVRVAQNKSFVEISWTDGGGTRFMWVDPEIARDLAAEIALTAAIAKSEQAKKVNAA